MAQSCAQCGLPLPIGSQSDHCHFHGGPPLITGAQIRCPFCKEATSADAKICKFCGEFFEQRLAVPTNSRTATANFCSACGIALPIGSETDRCWQHGGPPLTPQSQIRCPFCKEIIFAQATKCRFCGEFLSKRTSVVPAAPSLPAQQFPIGSMYCTFCGNVASPRGMNKFELIFVLIVSLFTLFIPLMIYLFVRSGNRCRRCGKKSLIPLTSPVAAAALQKIG